MRSLIRYFHHLIGETSCVARSDDSGGAPNDVRSARDRIIEHQQWRPGRRMRCDCMEEAADRQIAERAFEQARRWSMER